MSQYQVTGPFPFRGHEPGSTFTAEPDEAIERAIARGSISPTKKPGGGKTPSGKSRAKKAAKSAANSTSTPASPEKE